MQHHELCYERNVQIEHITSSTHLLIRPLPITRNLLAALLFVLKQHLFLISPINNDAGDDKLGIIHEFLNPTKEFSRPLLSDVMGTRREGRRVSMLNMMLVFRVDGSNVKRGAAAPLI